MHSIEEPLLPSRLAWGSVIKDYVSLTKPRIILLLVITAYCAMVVAEGHIPSVALTLATLVGLSLSTAGAHAVNMWYDRDIDPLMSRTSGRPVASGRIQPQHALLMGIVLELFSIVLLWVAVNPLTTVWSTAGFLFYVFIYTMWLKRRTPQNIVIGGAAGAFPPLVGWAAVTDHAGWPAWVMFLIIFMWTPPHFWSLALYKREDYRRAGIPMMPVARGEKATKLQSLIYAVLLLLCSLLLYQTHVVDMWYVAIAGILSLGFLAANVVLYFEKLPEVRWAKRTFGWSLLYMTGLFVAMVVGRVPH